SIDAPAGRSDTSEDEEYMPGVGDISNPRKNNQSKPTLTNSTLEAILKRGSFVNITATKHIYVNSSINIGSNGHLILSSENKQGGIKINQDITSTGGSLTINSSGWVDVHKNITLGTGFLNITSKDSVAFEKAGGDKSRAASNAQIIAQGTIRLIGEGKTFRLNNVSLNGTGDGLNIISTAGNLSHKLDGEINVSGKVEINQTTRADAKYWNTSYDSYWNVTSLNLENNANFTFVKFVSGNSAGKTTHQRSSAGVIFDSKSADMNFNIGQNAKVNFKLKSNENTNNSKPLPHQFKSNITVNGQGSVFFDIYANHSGRGVDFNMSNINVSGGANLTFNSHIRGDDAFKISKDLTVNADNSHLNIQQTQDNFNGNNFPRNAIKSTKNITILAGNVTLGGKDSSSHIAGNIAINSRANVTLQAHNGNGNNKKLTLGNVSVDGKLNLTGASADITGSLTVNSSATFNGTTDNNLNITGTFTNNGTSEINIKQGAVNIQGNIINEKSLSITTNAQGSQKTIIGGNITNKKGNLNITNKGSNTEIQIGGNISQKEGNLTISSDKVNITKQITIKAGVNGENSDSGTENNANLTIKTKTLELTNDLNISGFHKAEITAKDNSDLIIGKASSDSGNAGAQKVIFDKVKDSKISAGNHNVTLNSEVETSNGNSNAAGDSNGNNAGLTISAKDVAVNNNITSHKTINISATTGNVTTKEGTTINATTGGVEVTAKTGDIKGGIESKSGGVTLTATGDTLAVGNISGNTVSVTANSGTLTTKADSTIKGTGSVTTLSQSGDIGGTIS
ncbi:TPA: beta strand repeat-containing protein, partial [Haemophilus influenzae]